MEGQNSNKDQLSQNKTDKGDFFTPNTGRPKGDSRAGSPPRGGVGVPGETTTKQGDISPDDVTKVHNKGTTKTP